MHPDPPGQVVMAATMIEDLGLPQIVSQMNFTLEDGAWTSSSEAADITELKGSADTLSFTALEHALPWVLPEEAQLGVELTDLGRKLGRETLMVSGLPAGTYAVLIDGEEIVRATARELRDGLALHAITTTPQYQQSAKVAALNKQRNEGPVKTLRQRMGQLPVMEVPSVAG